MAAIVDKKLIEEAKQKRDRQLASDMRKIFGSAEGQNVLRWLMVECGYQRPSVVADKTTQQIYIDSTVYNEGRRNVWLQIRRYLTPKILIPVEIEPPESATKPIEKKDGSNVSKSKAKKRSRSSGG